MTTPDQERRLLWLASLLGCIGIVWTIWSVPHVLTNDGPTAVFTAHMEAHYDDPGSIYERQFSTGFGLSGRGFSWLYRPLAAAFSWPTSIRMSQAIMVLAFVLGFAWLAKAVSGKLRFSALLGFAIAFSWPFYMGLYAFTISMAAGLMVLAFIVSKSQGLTLIEKAAVCTALLVQVLLHGFAVLITLTLVGLVVLTRALMRRKSTPPAEWRRAALKDVAFLTVAALPSVAIFLFMRSAQAALAKFPGASDTEWAPVSAFAKVFPRLITPGSNPLGLVVLAVALVAIVRTVLRLRRGPRTPEEVAVVIGAVVLLAAAVLAPLHVPGWQFFSPRFLTTGLALALCLVSKEELEHKTARLVLTTGVAALGLCAILNSHRLNRRLATACEDALVGLDHKIARTAFQLPITFDASCGLGTEDTHLDVPFSTPLLHFYSLFAALHGGTVPYGFFGPAAVHAFVPRTPSLVPVPSLKKYWGLSKEDPRLTNPKTRAALLSELAVFGNRYENILFFGANAADRTLMLDRGYVIDFEYRSFLNAHFVPCEVELVSEFRPGDPPLRVSSGVRNDELWSANISQSEDKRTVTANLRTFCGNIWVRVDWEGNEQRCSNADARGRLAVHAAHEQVAHAICERH